MNPGHFCRALAAFILLLVAGSALAQPDLPVRQTLVAMTQADAMELASVLKGEILQGVVEVETRDRHIVVRVKADGAFPKGLATLRASYIPVLDRVRDAIAGLEGEYAVEGHSDDVPVSTARFRSNWELASARAVAVAHELMRGIDPARIVVKAYGPTRPLVANDTAANRARNERIEIVIEQGLHDEQYLSGETPLPGTLTWPVLAPEQMANQPDQDFF